MNIAQEFSRYALHYGNYNIIQNKVVEKLISDMSDKPKNILDIGCGSGAVYNKISWDIDSFIGVDFAKGMLEYHPKADNIICKQGDFNDKSLFEELKSEKIDYIISASALQWSIDIESVFKSLSKFNLPISFAIFTCKTFETLYTTAKLEPLLLCSDEVIANVNKYFKVKYELVSYTLEFESKKELFRYIKRSGVSGNRRVLKYKQTRKLMREYPHTSLEFEVLFIHSV